MSLGAPAFTLSMQKGFILSYHQRDSWLYEEEEEWCPEHCHPWCETLCSHTSQKDVLYWLHIAASLRSDWLWLLHINTHCWVLVILYLPVLESSLTCVWSLSASCPVLTHLLSPSTCLPPSEGSTPSRLSRGLSTSPIFLVLCIIWMIYFLLLLPALCLYSEMNNTLAHINVNKECVCVYAGLTGT